jgi:hypothetical protein
MGQPVVVEFAWDGVKIEVAARAEHRAQATGPLTTLLRPNLQQRHRSDSNTPTQRW